MDRTLHEYRPGQFMWIEDGQVVGKATPEEVQAWQGMTLFQPASDLWQLFSRDADVDKAKAAISARYGIPLGEVKVKETGGGLLVGPVPKE